MAILGPKCMPIHLETLVGGILQPVYEQAPLVEGFDSSGD